MTRVLILHVNSENESSDLSASTIYILYLQSSMNVEFITLSLMIWCYLSFSRFCINLLSSYKIHCI